ncbi:MAG: GlsB/YeaQ/YmgE family stress response membrane protein [Pseudomonadota bacterium]
MGILSWIVLGLIAGALAKWLMPGRDGGGWIATTLLGIAGAMLGGYVGTQMGYGGVDGIDIRSIVTAALGAIVLLIIYRMIK